MHIRQCALQHKNVESTEPLQTHCAMRCTWNISAWSSETGWIWSYDISIIVYVYMYIYIFGSNFNTKKTSFQLTLFGGKSLHPVYTIVLIQFLKLSYINVPNCRCQWIPKHLIGFRFSRYFTLLLWNIYFFSWKGSVIKTSAHWIFQMGFQLFTGFPLCHKKGFPLLPHHTLLLFDKISLIFSRLNSDLQVVGERQYLADEETVFCELASRWHGIVEWRGR